MFPWRGRRASAADEAARRNLLTTQRDFLAARIGEAALAAHRGARAAYKDLWDAEVQVYSQWGEDGIIEFLCDCLDIARPRAVEFGAGNFVECNTRFLAEHRHASVVAVDARDDLVSSVQAMSLYWQTSLLPIQEWVTPETGPRLLSRAREFMGGIDLFSLDLDGNDYWVAEALDLYDVRIIVAEYNPLFGAHRAVTVPRDDHFDRAKVHFTWLYYGASIRAWLHLFGERGFTFLGTNRPGNNAFFCRTNCVAKIPLAGPATEDLTRYVDWRVRESRDPEGRLDYLSGPDRLSAIRDMPVVDVVTDQRLVVGDLDKPV